jgi:DNA processing protein
MARLPVDQQPAVEEALRVAEDPAPRATGARLEQAELLAAPPAAPLDEERALAEERAPTEERTNQLDYQPPPAVAYVSPEALAAPEASSDDPDLPYWLALNRIKGIGPARFRLLLDAFGSAEAAWRGTASAWQAAGLDARTAAAFERQRRGISPEGELERLARLRVGALRYIDDGYPSLLREVALPPAILYVRGALTRADDWALAIVGTRRATGYGKQVTDRLAGELARQGITIVSGLARGIDTHAHTAALEAGGRTIAVLGCGPDLVYPPENAKLAARILESGAVVTEFAPGTQPEAGNFPARNRLISGLALGVLVTEAPQGSGALITTRFAAEQGRDVFAVPGNITSRSSAGSNRLIQDGAKLVTEVADITTELNLHLVPEQRELREALPENEGEAQLLSRMEAAGEPLHIDELCRATGLPVAQISGTLVMMELKGLVRLVGAMTYAPAR